VSSNVVFQRGADTAWRTIVGETIVVHLDAKEFFGLNETAADVWHALDGSADLEVISARFGIAPEDVATFCAELQKLGLVDVVDDGEAPSEDSPTSDSELAGDPRTEVVDSPRIVWREEIRQVAASCAFSPGMNPLCTQVPFS
jgi:hypothetical protein